MGNQNYSAFDIIGPRMIGPSSSHTAGAARLAYVAGRIAGPDIQSVRFELYNSFALTGRGHGTDRALLAGILGMQPDDERLPNAYALADARGLKYEFIMSQGDASHPNTVRITLTHTDGSATCVVGASIGGGSIRISQINGLDVELTGDYPTLIIAHHDRPGAVSLVTGVIARHQVNIAFMRVFRRRKGDEAFMVIETDQHAPAELVKGIKELGDVIEQVMSI